MLNIRIHLLPAALLALSGIANATPPPQAASSLPPNAPARCVALLHQTPIEGGLISAGNCLAEARMNETSLKADSASANALASATAPSIALFDRVIAESNPYWSIIAEDAKRDTYQSMAVRLRRTVPLDDAITSQRVDSLVASWNDNAAASTARIVQLAATHPDVGSRDPVIAGISNRAQTEQAKQVATRGRAPAENRR